MAPQKPTVRGVLGSSFRCYFCCWPVSIPFHCVQLHCQAIATFLETECNDHQQVNQASAHSQICLLLHAGAAARLLHRLEGGAAAGAPHPAAAAPPAAPAVDAAGRQRSRAHLAKAVTANARLGMSSEQAAAAAQVNGFC